VTAGRDPRLRTRRDDRRWVVAYFWMFVVSLVLLVAVSRSSDAVSKVREGRERSQQVVCAVMSAAIDAGRAQILNVPELPPRLEAALEAQGYPTLGQRRAAAREAARAYAQTMAVAVRDTLGPEGRGIVRADGTLDCVQLGRVTSGR
jgi:hypothetical protein